MTADMAALPDTQRAVIAAGEALAKELGLTKIDLRGSLENIGFHDGQTVLEVTPNGMNIGTIRVTVGEFAGTRYTTYFLNAERLLQKTERFRNEQWVPLFSPELDQRLSPQAVLYVSKTNFHL